MNQHLGASYGLSVLIVVVFAVAFFKADPPTASRPAGLVTVPERISPPAPRRSTTARSPAADRGEIRTPPQFVRGESTVPSPPKRPAITPTEPAIPGSVARPVSIVRSSPAGTTSRPTSKSGARATPRKAAKGAFATVEPGETLADVAARVYGTTDRADDLWRSNRDCLPSREDGQLPAGMLLRTP